MRCLFEAYEHVLSLLENVFTPMFCHSDEVSVKDMNSNLKGRLYFLEYPIYNGTEKYVFICIHFLLLLAC